MKRSSFLTARRAEPRPRPAMKGRDMKTVLTFEKRAQVYCWSVDRGIVKPVIKH